MGEFIVESFAQQCLFHRVQASVLPGIQVRCQVCIQEPVVQEGSLLLVLQVGLDHQLEKLGILVVEEEIQFVTGILRIQGTLLFFFQSWPGEQEAEFSQLRVLA